MQNEGKEAAITLGIVAMAIVLALALSATVGLNQDATFIVSLFVISFIFGRMGAFDPF